MNPTLESDHLPPLPTIKTLKKSLPMASNLNPKSPKTSLFPSPSSSSPPSYSPTITQIAQDQILSILRLLPPESILSFSMTCRKFRSLASSDSLWEFICRTDWGSGAVDALLASFSSHERRGISWKSLYKEVSQLSSLSCHRLLSTDGVCPRSRASHSLNFVSDCLVLFGGGCEGGRHLDDTWVAHIGGNQYNRLLTWHRVNSGTPSGRFGQSCTVVGDALVLFGGIHDNGVRQNDTWVGHINHVGSPELNITWQLLDDVGPIAPPPRGAHAACRAGDHRLVVIHGGIGLHGLRLSDTWLLDLSDDLQSARWRQIANSQPSPPARSGHSLTWIGGTLMVLFGGRGSGYEVLNDLWVLDVNGGEQSQWTEIKDGSSSNIMEMPLPRVGHSASLILGGKVLIYGGEDSERHRKDDFWVLDAGNLLKSQPMGWKRTAARGLWKRLRLEGCDGPDHRSFHGACTDRSGRYVYIFGGMVDGAAQTGEAYGLTFDGRLYHVELVLQL